MQRGVLLGAGAVILIAGGALALRAVSHHEVTGASEQKVDHELAELLSGASITHGAIVEDGLTGTATVHDLAVARPDGERWTAATMVLSGVHAAALRDVFDPANYPNGHPAWTDRRKLLGDVTLNDVRLSTAGDTPTEVTIAKAELHGLSGRPFAQPPTAQNRAAPGFAADAALAFAYDSERLIGLAASQKGPEGFKMTLASGGGDGYDSGKLASLDVKSLALDATTGAKHTSFHVAVGALNLKGADASSLLAAVQTGGASSTLTRFSYGTAEGTDLALQMTQGPAVSIHDIRAEQSAPDGSGTIEKHGKLTGMTMALGDMPVPPDTQAEIAAFGLNAITLDISASQRNKADGSTDFQDDFNLHDLGTLHLKGSFSGYVAPAGAGASPVAALAGLLATTIQQATLVWDDRSLTSRLFKVAAEGEHTTPAALHQQLAIPIVALSVMLPDQPDAADQVTRFLDNPHQLTIALHPPASMSLGQVAQAPAAERAHLLGVHISSQ